MFKIYKVRRKLCFCKCPARVRTTATLVRFHSKQTEPMATIASKTCLLGYTSQPVSQTRMWLREITRGDDNNKDGGSAIRKTENGFIFLIYWLLAVLDRPSCPHQVLLAVMFTHRSPSQSFLASYWQVKGAGGVDWFVLRKPGAVFDLAQHSRITLVVNPEK